MLQGLAEPMATFRPLLFRSRGVRLDKLLDDMAVLAESLVAGDKLLELHAIFELFWRTGSQMATDMRPHVRSLGIAVSCMSRTKCVPIT